MKIIRMTKTASGPSGTFPTGMVRTVDDMTAAMLIGAEAAELVANVAQPPADSVSRETLTPPPSPSLYRGGEEEVAALEGAPEMAVAARPAKKSVKKA